MRREVRSLDDGEQIVPMVQVVRLLFPARIQFEDGARDRLQDPKRARSDLGQLRSVQFAGQFHVHSVADGEFVLSSLLINPLLVGDVVSSRVLIRLFSHRLQVDLLLNRRDWVIRFSGYFPTGTFCC